VDLLVHAGIDHHVPVAVNDLEHRARLHAGVGSGAFDRKILGAVALGKLQNVDAQWPRAWNCGGNAPDILDAGRPRGHRILSGYGYG
jgi:hypothetical protein